MTEWNPNNPFDLDVWDELGLTPPPMPSLIPKESVKLNCLYSPWFRWGRLPTIQEAPIVSDFKPRFVSPKKSLESYQKGFVPKITLLGPYGTSTNGGKLYLRSRKKQHVKLSKWPLNLSRLILVLLSICKSLLLHTCNSSQHAEPSCSFGSAMF